jgi:hypothetical protein
MNIAWRVMRHDRPQMLSRMNLRITGRMSGRPPRRRSGLAPLRDRRFQAFRGVPCWRSWGNRAGPTTAPGSFATTGGSERQGWAEGLATELTTLCRREERQQGAGPLRGQASVSLSWLLSRRRFQNLEAERTRVKVG